MGLALCMFLSAAMRGAQILSFSASFWNAILIGPMGPRHVVDLRKAAKRSRGLFTATGARGLNPP